MPRRNIAILLGVGAVAGILALLLIFLGGSHFRWESSDGSTNINIQIGGTGDGSTLFLSTVAIVSVVLFAAFSCRSGSGGKEQPPKSSDAGRNSGSFLEFLNRVHTSRRDVWIGGVCGGLGEHTNVPSWVWRMLFAVAIFGYGVGVMAYVALWIFVPEPRRVENDSEEKSRA